MWCFSGADLANVYLNQRIPPLMYQYLGQRRNLLMGAGASGVHSQIAQDRVALEFDPKRGYVTILSK